MKIYVYRLWCEVDGYVLWYLPEGDPAPTTCPNDSSHEVDLESIAVIEIIDSETASVKLDEQRTSTGLPKMSFFEPEGSAATLVSHNFCDKCSWHDGSIQVIDDVLNNTSGNTFASLNGKTHWIDLKHGRLYGEDYLVSSHPVIKVDGVVKIETLPDLNISGDYTINYESGEVTFNEEVLGTVTATYRYADKSWFRIKPTTGKILTIKSAEVQFGSDVALNGYFYFDVWYNHPLAGWVQVPNTRIAYKNFKDFVSAANEGQGLIPAIGDLTNDVYVFPFNYARPKPIRDSQAIEIRVYKHNHQPCHGNYATATFYILSEDE
jgi:hypothetical protein